jgi:hypothetical protein
MSLRDIARALTEEGYPTPRGAPAWSAKLIWWILRRRSLPSFVHGSLGARGVEKGGRLGRSVPRRRLSPEERQDLDDAEVRRLRALRPKTRGDCEGGPRPCAWVSCKWHLALDVDKETGVVRLNFPRGAEYRGEIDWEGMRESCALDVADRGDVTSLEEVGDITGLSKVAVLKIGREALAKAYDAGLALDPFVEE